MGMSVDGMENEEDAVINYVSGEETREFVHEVMKRSDESVNVLPKGVAKKVLTEKRIEVIERVQSDDIGSISDLSRKLDRDPSIVKRDLDILRKYGVIDYREEGNRKVPFRTADKVVVEPF